MAFCNSISTTSRASPPPLIPGPYIVEKRAICGRAPCPCSPAIRSEPRLNQLQSFVHTPECSGSPLNAGFGSRARRVLRRHSANQVPLWIVPRPPWMVCGARPPALRAGREPRKRCTATAYLPGRGAHGRQRLPFSPRPGAPKPGRVPKRRDASPSPHARRVKRLGPGCTRASAITPGEHPGAPRGPRGCIMQRAAHSPLSEALAPLGTGRQEQRQEQGGV
jgi:hypothetical protein